MTIWPGHVAGHMARPYGPWHDSDDDDDDDDGDNDDYEDDDSDDDDDLGHVNPYPFWIKLEADVLRDLMFTQPFVFAGGHRSFASFK